MNTDIRYIFLDLGGTFRVIDEDPAYLAAARAKIAELCGVKTEDPTRWFEDVIVCSTKFSSSSVCTLLRL